MSPKRTPLRIIELPKRSAYYQRGYRFIVTGPLVNGKRWRNFFKFKKEAETFFHEKQVELANRGTALLELPEIVRVAAVEAQETLAKYGATIQEAVRFYVNHIEKEKKLKDSKTVDAVKEEYLKWQEKKNLRPATLLDLRSRAGKVASFFYGRPMAGITPADVNAFVDHAGGSPRNRLNNLKKCSQLFNYAKRQGYVVINPCGLAERVKVDESGDITVLPPSKVRGLLETALQHDRALVPYVAIGAFAGLRVKELKALLWEEIDFTQKLIEVKAGKAKTRQRRLVDICDTLMTWVMPFRKRAGLVVDGFNFRKRFENVRTLAEFPTWEPNCLRHSCASYRVALEPDLAKVALQMGHDVETLLRYYRGIVKPEAAKEYWGIVPPEKTKTIAFPVA
ncbi:MAG: site-specific integrase [Verrucomicrobiae bacterium]|nr:site-specific integrase [Verrucomicrobiae bacterium]